MIDNIKNIIPKLDNNDSKIILNNINEKLKSKKRKNFAFILAPISLILVIFISISSFLLFKKDIKNDSIIFGSYNQSITIGSNDVLPYNYKAYESFKSKIEIKESIYNKDQTINIRIYLGSLYDDVLVDDKLTLEVITDDFTYTQSDTLNTFIPTNYPTKEGLFNYKLDKYIDFSFTKKDIIEDQYLDIKFVFKGEIILDEFELSGEELELYKNFKREYKIGGYLVDGIIVLAENYYPTYKANYYLYEHGYINKKELSKRHYKLMYSDYILINRKIYYANSNEYIMEYESENLVMLIKINDNNELLNEFLNVIQLQHDYIKENGSYKHEYFIEEYRKVCKMFIDYCLNKNYIDNDIYEKELYTIYTKNKIGNSRYYNSFMDEYKRYARIVNNNNDLICNYKR